MAISTVSAPNLMANVSQPLPANLRVQPKPIIGGSDLKAITDQQNQVYQEAMNFGRMNPDVVLKALGDGGSLSNSFGFSNAVDVAGLTPDQLMALTQGRGVDQSLNSAQKTFDNITGAPEKRAMMFRKGDQQFGVNSQMLAQQNNQDFAAQNANVNNQIQTGTQQAQLTNSANIANAGFQNQASLQANQIESNEKIAAAQNQRMIESLRFQMQAHRENAKLQRDTLTANKKADLLEKASNSLIGVLTSKDPSEMNAALANNLLMQHPELNQDGTYYEYAKPWFGSNGLVPQKLVPATLKNGTKIWMKNDNTFFSIRP